MDNKALAIVSGVLILGFVTITMVGIAYKPIELFPTKTHVMAIEKGMERAATSDDRDIITSEN